MNTEYTEKFDRERFKGGEIASSMTGEMYGEVFLISFVSESESHDSFKVKFGDGSLGYRGMFELTMYWRMKPKASDDWIPVVDGKCPIDQTDHRKYEAILFDGAIAPLDYIDIHDSALWKPIWFGSSIVAVRLIKPQVIGEIDYESVIECACYGKCEKCAPDEYEEREKQIQNDVDKAVDRTLQKVFGKDKPETPKQRASREAWERFQQSTRYRAMHQQQVSMIGEAEESRIAGEALAAFDRVWPVRKENEMPVMRIRLLR